MGCTSAKQVSAVPNDEEGRGKAYSNGDLFTDEYKIEGVEEVKYMGDENPGKCATRRTWRRVMYSTGANSRKRSLQRTSSLSETTVREEEEENGT
ncbi:uncharacterized protein AKAME5_001405300 [Lates japonicus]|uniref:Uncharacterized protein n=1 Tax=Lates japonicus TaxID=270547 RepID=A0AAD3MZI0_LATJO|nr:uncharacterized protein AKAME5_001405300 [Lates japonicus]